MHRIFSSRRGFACLVSAFFSLNMPALGGDAVSVPTHSYPSYGKAADIPAHVFARDSELERVHLSPDGKFLLMVTPENTRFRISVVPIDPNDKRQYYTTLLPKNQFMAALWGNDNRVLIVGQAWNYDRNWNLIAHRGINAAQHDGRSAESILKTDYKSSKTYTVDTILSTLPDDPNNILVTYSENGREWPDIFKLDIYTGVSEKVSDGYRYIDDWYPDGRGNVRFGMGWYKQKFYMVARTTASGAWRELPIDGVGDIERFAFMGYDPDNPAIARVRATKAGTDRDKIYAFDLKTGVLGEVIFEHPKYDAGWLISGRNYQMLAAYTNGERLEKAYFNPDFESKSRGLDKALPGMDNRIVQITPNGSHFMVFAQSAQNAGGYYRYDTQTKHLDQFGLVNASLNPDYLSEVSAISYQARDGLTIPAYITEPKEKAEGPMPLVVMPHGGPWAKDNFQYDYWAQFVASRGVMVLQPNFRGSDGFGRAFEQKGYGEWGGAMIDDLADGVSYLVKQGKVDPSRVCIMGGSYGGYAALMGAIRYGDMFKCALALSPVTDLKEWYSTLKERSGKDFGTRILGKTGRSVFKDHNPIRRADELQIPLVILHGSDDHQVPFKHSEKMVAALEKEKRKPTFIELEDEGHNIVLSKSRTLLLRETEKLIDKHLKS